MARTLEEVISEIKNRLDIVEVVSETVILKKNGGRYWGLCPFHKEKTPSFSVSPSMGIYKCFGCGEGGDALSFIMKTKNMEFMDVIKDLAQKYNIELPTNYKKSEDKKDLKNQMMSACEKAALFYHDLLVNHKSEDIKTATEYLTERSISREIIDKFTLGIAPKSYSTLYDILKKDFSDAKNIGFFSNVVPPPLLQHLMNLFQQVVHLREEIFFCGLYRSLFVFIRHIHPDSRYECRFQQAEAFYDRIVFVYLLAVVGIEVNTNHFIPEPHGDLRRDIQIFHNAVRITLRIEFMCVI